MNYAIVGFGAVGQGGHQHPDSCAGYGVGVARYHRERRGAGLDANGHERRRSRERRGLWFLWILRFTVLQSSAETLGFGAGFDDMSAIGDAIDERLAQPGVRNHLGPFGEGQVGGQDDGGFFGPFGHDLEQEFSAHFSQWHIADFIECDQVITGPAGEHASLRIEPPEK
jgi:hypothetical protein